jgi:large subunit ribosomal protein L29e
MAKSKNHTNHNQSVKTHKNGIKKAPPVFKFRSIRGSWLPGLVNARFVRKANQKVAVAARKARLAKFRASIKK